MNNPHDEFYYNHKCDIWTTILVEIHDYKQEIRRHIHTPSNVNNETNFISIIWSHKSTK